jgi:hypothetical protein
MGYRNFRGRGLQSTALEKALVGAGVKQSEANHSDKWPRLPGSAETGDPYGYHVKPEGVPYWDQPPSTEEEWNLYYGVHIHSESNPLGLHTHIRGGKMGGGHTHGPQNRFGVHHHKTEEVQVNTTGDGHHTHEGENFPGGKHNHRPENFG